MLSASDNGRDDLNQSIISTMEFSQAVDGVNANYFWLQMLSALTCETEDATELHLQ